MEYFTYEKITNHITRIVDITSTSCYLVEGKDKACLVDTGSGVGNLREVVDSLTSLPYDVILTHGHVDHASGAGDFADKKIYLHPDDMELMNVHIAFENRLDYVKHTTGKEVSESELTPCIDSSVTLPLHDKDTFDLGDYHLQIIHTPGHTHGMCMILFKEDRIILFGDGCGVSVMILDEYSTSVEEYLEVLHYVKQYENEYDRIVRNHGTFVSEKENLDNVIECCKKIINGTDDHVKATGLPFHYDDAYFAKEISPETHERIDGKQGNLAYRPCKIKKLV